MRTERIEVKPPEDPEVATLTVTRRELALIRDVLGVIRIDKVKRAYNGLDVYPIYQEVESVAELVGVKTSGLGKIEKLFTDE